MRVGLISDTHGMLRPEALAALRGVDHILHAGDIGAAAAGVDVVLCGHSHKPAIFEERGVLYVNPGSAGPRRFSLPIAVADLMIGAGRATARIHVLEVPR